MLRTQVGLPPLYTCVKCGQEIELKAQSTLQMVRGWAKQGKKTLSRVEEDLPFFIHEWCLALVPVTMDTLF